MFPTLTANWVRDIACGKGYLPFLRTFGEESELTYEVLVKASEERMYLQYAIGRWFDKEEEDAISVRIKEVLMDFRQDRNRTVFHARRALVIWEALLRCGVRPDTVKSMELYLIELRAKRDASTDT